MTEKVRLDVLLVQRGMAASQPEAQRRVIAGQVRVAGQVTYTPGARVPADAEIQLDPGPRYVSRGGEKLEAALQAFHLEVTGRVCADVGASTGGFTDCLLQHGARRIYAVDVGKGILEWSLRQDPRVVVMEGTNARQVNLLPEPVSLVTIDASFISLTVLLPVVLGWFQPSDDVTSRPIGDGSSNHFAGIFGELIALVKPQFEASRLQAGRSKGVIRDAAVHRQVLSQVLEFALRLQCQVNWLIASPLLGPKGNREFLAWLSYPARPGYDSASLPSLIDTVIPSS